MKYWFGKNWNSFVKVHLNPEAIAFATLRLQELLGPIKLDNRSFLDIGCGSGLHSLAAMKLNAKKVVSIDVDPLAVSTSNEVRNRFGSEYKMKWEIKEVSILEEQKIGALGKFDLTYAWGSLHHSGDVWRAISNACNTVAPKGHLVLALYSKDVVPVPGHEFWMKKKVEYLETSPLGRRRMEMWYIWRFLLDGNLLKTPIVIRRFRNYKEDRGMSLMVDIRDWLGGWPMEFVGDKEVQDFVETRGFRALQIKTGKANTEFVFQRVD